MKAMLRVGLGCLLLCLSACTIDTGAIGLGGRGASDPGLNEPDSSAGQDIQIQLQGNHYSGVEIQSAIVCYQNSSSTQAQQRARVYTHLLEDASDNHDTLETAYYSVASQIQQEQQEFTLNCL